jgi:GT2 family glycosyltransferase
MKPLAVMPTYLRSEGDLRLTLISINTLLKTADVDLLVVDDGSPDKRSLFGLLEGREVGYEVISKDRNEGFARTVNHGLRRARDERRDALLVNADMQFVDEGWLDRMVAAEGDVVGALLLYGNGLIQHAGVYYSVVLRQFDHIYRFAPGTLREALRARVCPVTAALQLIRHETLETVGLYDEDFQLGYEDMDFCHRVFESGRTCRYEPNARAIHHESMFRGQRDPKHERWMEESFRLLHEKHAGHSFAEYTPTLLIDE